MNRQKSFENERPTLYLVATPIGNLDEMTYRSINTLKNVKYIAAEDTRNTVKLLNHFEISTKLISHHEHNIKQSIPKLIQLLEEGNDIALVSDAGYPAISDPGYELVKEAIEHEINVVPISGCNACLDALVVSGIAPQPFMFYGFLDHLDKKKKKELIDGWIANQRMISRIHAKIVRVNNRFFIIDEESLNGTYLNGKKNDHHRCYRRGSSP